MSAPSSAKALLAPLEASLGSELVAKIRSSNLLVVGAGGIGCELLKNLALSGFCKLTVIDLDTIDVSNLNRQLLFRSQHVGQPKCNVACQVAASMAIPPTDGTEISYTPLHGNVCDNSLCNVPFVSQFDLVLNALDNITARRRVNRLCLAASVPLVEAGTTGYLGQVNVIDKDSNVACYECQTQEAPKVYPICTIRSTPSMPVHTIVWAKELYKLLFHPKVEESMLFEDPEGDEPSTFMEAVFNFRKALAETTAAGDEDKNVANQPTTTEPADTTALGKVVLQKMYIDEIQKQLDMDRYKTARKTPVVLDAGLIEKGSLETPPTQRSTYKTTDVWNATDCVAELLACLADAAAATASESNTVLPEFDKDDNLAMRFVTAASNLRSHVFSIEPLQSFYSAKGIAGNIIPAIATTNAICAGLQILQAFQILKMQVEKQSKTGNLRDYCRYVNCLRGTTRNGLYLTAPELEKPNPNCYVCRGSTIPLSLNTLNWTLQELLDKIIKKDLGFDEPSLMLEGDMIWEEGEDADDSFQVNLVKKLPSLPSGGIVHGTVISIEDFSQDLTVEVIVTHQEVWEKSKDEEEAGAEEVDDTYKFVVGGTKPTVATKAASAQTKEATDKSSDGDDVVYMEAPGENEDDDRKRPAKSTAPNGDQPPAKKAKSTSNGSNGADHEVIEIA